LKQSRRYFHVISYRVEYEIWAEEGRSGFGGRHFPKRGNRPGGRISIALVSPCRRDSRFDKGRQRVEQYGISAIGGSAAAGFWPSLGAFIFWQRGMLADYRPAGLAC
jgi:hypothetical protein